MVCIDDLICKWEACGPWDLHLDHSAAQWKKRFRTTGLYRYQHVEVDSSLFVSERICGVRCWKLRHYSFIPFLLSLSVYSELTEIKTFTSINLAQSLHVCKRVLVWYPLAHLHGLKQKYFQHWHNQLPRPPYRKHTEPWHHCVVSNRTVNFVNRYTPNIYILCSLQALHLFHPTCWKFICSRVSCGFGETCSATQINCPVLPCLQNLLFSPSLLLKTQLY